MRNPRVVVTAMVVACGSLLALGTSSGAAVETDGKASISQLPTPIYLALGDSIAAGTTSVGTQTVASDHGYVNDLYATERPQLPRLKLIDLGCPGATTSSMMGPGTCQFGAQKPYPEPTKPQLMNATQLLKGRIPLPSYLGFGAYDTNYKVVLVTIDIGANDLVSTPLSTIEMHLKTILSDLRQASKAGPDPAVPIVGMNYYDRALGQAFTGNGRCHSFANCLSAAEETVGPFMAIANGFSSVYKSEGDLVADTASTFQTTNMTPLNPGGIPANVELICLWTGECASSGGEHPTAAGHQAIAATLTPLVDLAPGKLSIGDAFGTSSTTGGVTTLTVTYVPNPGFETPPTGVIEFTVDGNIESGCAAVPLSSKNSCNVRLRPGSTHSWSAVYLGDANYAPSWSGPEIVHVPA